MKYIAFDISGLNYKHNSGVQKVLYSYIQGYLEYKKKFSGVNVNFYDRSGYFNIEMYKLLGENYLSINKNANNSSLFCIIFYKILSTFSPYQINLSNNFNHVWNYNIFKKNAFSNSITIHDLLPIQFPNFYNFRMKLLTSKSLKFALKEADHIIFISKSTQSDFHKILGKPKGKETVIYNGISPVFFKKQSKIFQSAVLEKFNLTEKKFFISIGYIDQRKNLINQVKAFMEVVKKHKNYYYVITGFLNHHSNKLLEIIDKFNIKKNIIFLGYVEESELVTLINASQGLIYCSLYEGFGLPIVEAYSQKTPIITSNNSSMRELGSNNRAMLVDPFDYNAIARGMSMIIDKKYFKLIDIEKSYKFSKNFTISKMFESYINFFYE